MAPLHAFVMVTCLLNQYLANFRVLLLVSCRFSFAPCEHPAGMGSLLID
jgi:hypothetical protein